MVLEIVPETLLGEDTIFENVNEVARTNLRKVVRDDDGCRVDAVSLESFEDKDAGRRVQRGRGFICREEKRVRKRLLWVEYSTHRE